MGDRRAEATLGIRYQDGDGVKADDHAAAYWYGLAAAQGHRASQYALAGMYLEGEGGLPKDPPKATELLIKSASQGFEQAQYALGFQYEVGDDVPRNRQKAIELFRASGDGIWIANALADRNTPARFANFGAFGSYLASLRNAEFAAAWARAQATLPHGGGGGNIMAIMKLGQYRGAGGSNTGQTLGGYTASHN
jgi:TPR repeat protein